MIAHRQSVFIVLAIVFVAAFSGCKTTTNTQSEWTEWKPISEGQSVVQIIWPEGGKPLEIKRNARGERYKYIKQEVWSWGSGEAFIQKLPDSMYMMASTHDSEIIRDMYRNWQKLKRINFEIPNNEIQFGVNKIGKYFYAASEKTSTGQTCFIYHQAFPEDLGAQYFHEKNASSGFISGYECAPTKRFSAEQLTERMLPFVENLRMRR